MQLKVKKTSILVVAIILTGLSAGLFISYNNDHAECASITQSRLSENGVEIVETRHICNEKYSF